MTKQTPVTEKEKVMIQIPVAEKDSGAITPDTIMYRFKLYNQFIDKVRQQNLEAGLDVKRNNDFVSQNKLVKQGVYEEFIQKTVNAKNNTWFTLTSLQAAGVISDLDIEQFPSRDYPYFRLNRITRIKDSRGEWLQFIYTVYALTKERNATNRVISDGDFYYKPSVTYRYVPEDPINPDGKQIHVGIVNGAGFGDEPTGGVKVQLTPYSKEKVLQTIQAIPPIGPYADRYNGCGLNFIKEGEASKAISVTSLDELMTDNFDDVWNNYRGKNANAKVDVKELVAELSKQSISKGDHNQYG